jgi:hypothetical protein
MKYLIILSLLFSSISYATEEQCRSVLSKCDLAVQDLQKENNIQKQIILDEDTRFKIQTSELNREEFWRPIAIAGVSLAILEGIVLSFKK